MVLHGDESRPAVLLLQMQQPGELKRAHRRRAEVTGLPGLDDVVERLQRLLGGCAVVEPVDHVDVHVVGAEPPQAVVDLGHDGLAGQALAVGPGAHRVPDLCADHHVVAVGVIVQRPAEDLLAGAERIQVGGVEEVDARV